MMTGFGDQSPWSHPRQILRDSDDTPSHLRAAQSGGSGNMVGMIRCDDCDVAWRGIDRPCWMCGTAPQDD